MAQAMQEAKQPSTTAKLPPPSPSPSPSAPAPNALPYHQHYGTFPPPVVYHASPIGFGGQGVVAFPSTVQQQVFVEGIPVREPPLPFCGVGIGWFLDVRPAEVQLWRRARQGSIGVVVACTMEEDVPTPSSSHSASCFTSGFMLAIPSPSSS